ncbi:transposase [Salmonella enterica subsp. enterica serovar Glostrup]|nr:transposase [Salmonella enterica subsp. enterica serovar Glostrup]
MKNRHDWRNAPRKVYSTEFKMRMIELALLPGASVAAIARDHGFNDNLLFRWLRLWKTEGRLTRRALPAPADNTALIPVVTEHPDASELPSAPVPATACRIELLHGTIVLQNPSAELLCSLIRELSGSAFA